MSRIRTGTEWCVEPPDIRGGYTLNPQCVACHVRCPVADLVRYSRSRYAHARCLVIINGDRTESDLVSLLDTPAGREYFWRHVDRSGGPDACHPWRGDRTKQGYGRIHLGGVKGRRVLAHRIALALSGVSIDGAHGRHSCDNPPCCNTRHLLPGTQADNMRDAVERGRMASGAAHGLHKHPERIAHGEQHGRHVLTLDEVRAIRAGFTGLGRGYPSNAVALAARYGVVVGTIHDIVSGRTWKDDA
jgi:hypothetical protein